MPIHCRLAELTRNEIIEQNEVQNAHSQCEITAARSSISLWAKKKLWKGSQHAFVCGKTRAVIPSSTKLVNTSQCAKPLSFWCFGDVVCTVLSSNLLFWPSLLRRNNVLSKIRKPVPPPNSWQKNVEKTQWKREKQLFLENTTFFQKTHLEKRSKKL